MLYVLDGHQPVKVEDPIEFSDWFGRKDRVSECQVGRDKVNELIVSTVFLGIDQSPFSGRHELFETMAFECDGLTPLPGTTRRYANWTEAEEGHKQTISKLSKSA